jgi:UDP-glucose 4-epimerase
MGCYLVTGGCGFIGSHLVDALILRGDGVRILDNLSTGSLDYAAQGAELVVGDVADCGCVEQAMEGVDGCFHLAAIASVPRSIEDWLGTHAVNQTGTIAVFNAARSRCVPVVYASSAAVYGGNQRVPLTEGAHTAPTSAYGADKLACELHARVASEVHGVPTTGFRFFNVYGPRQNPASPYSGVISIFCDRLIMRRPLLFHGDGQQVRDFIYVEDVVNYLLAGMERASTRPNVFNVCTGRGTTISELAGLLARLMETEPVIERRPRRAGDIRRSIGDPSAGERYLGVTAKTPLADGLRRTVEFLELDAWFH